MIETTPPKRLRRLPPGGATSGPAEPDPRWPLGGGGSCGAGAASALRRTGMNLIAQARFDSPLGPLTVAATERGIAGLWFDGQAHHPGPLNAPVASDNRLLKRLRVALDAYWAGEPLPELPLDLQGTAFQRTVWLSLLRIGRGTTTTYAQIAQGCGSALAVRAAGAAIGRNPACIVVPCHRVIGRDGSLTGYAGGLARKRALLELEGALS
jgi:methylated-DNA-[protein]-cysteine S-methyltransferase